jgi:hypothetical protein
MRGTRHRTPAYLIVVAVLVCAGCATVPTGGRVVTGRPTERAEPIDDPYVRMIPVPPGKDWTPDRIVQGFLAASAGFDDQHKVARRYLASGVVWQPDPRPVVTVYDKQTEVIFAGKADDPSGMVSVRGSQLGKIGSDGQYAADARPLDQTFRLVKNAQGQWRISELPDRLTNSLLLSTRDVARAFRTRNLYFFAPDARVLVPNPVFLPLVIRRDLPAQIVVAELNGPTAWLSHAVTTWFPTGTRLLGGVDVIDGVATVNLSREAWKGNQQGMSAQLMWALKQLSEVKRMRLQIDGKTIDPGLSDSIQSPRDWAKNDPDSATGDASQQPVYLRDAEGRLEELIAGKTSKVAPLARARIFQPAVSLDLHQVAGLTKGHDGVLMGDLTVGSTVQKILSADQPGGKFTQPSWDRLGNLWVVEMTSDHSWLWIKAPGKAPARVDHWDLGGSKVLALRVARDGVRVAAIVQADKHAQIRLGRIAGYGTGDLTADNFLPISSDVDAIDLAWADADELAVLGRTDQAGPALPYTVPVSGGTSRPIGTGTQGNMRTITAAPDSPVLVSGQVTGKDSTADQVCRLHDPGDRLFSQWDCPVAGADPAYPG